MKRFTILIFVILASVQKRTLCLRLSGKNVKGFKFARTAPSVAELLADVGRSTKTLMRKVTIPRIDATMPPGLKFALNAFPEEALKPKNLDVLKKAFGPHQAIGSLVLRPTRVGYMTDLLKDSKFISGAQNVKVDELVSAAQSMPITRKSALREPWQGITLGREAKLKDWQTKIQNVRQNKITLKAAGPADNAMIIGSKTDPNNPAKTITKQLRPGEATVIDLYANNIADTYQSSPQTVVGIPSAQQRAKLVDELLGKLKDSTEIANPNQVIVVRIPDPQGSGPIFVTTDGFQLKDADIISQRTLSGFLNDFALLTPKKIWDKAAFSRIDTPASINKNMAPSQIMAMSTTSARDFTTASPIDTLTRPVDDFVISIQSDGSLLFVTKDALGAAGEPIVFRLSGINSPVQQTAQNIFFFAKMLKYTTRVTITLTGINIILAHEQAKKDSAKENNA